MKRNLAIVLAVLILGALLAGCSGGKESHAVSEKVAKSDAFQTEANEEAEPKETEPKETAPEPMSVPDLAEYVQARTVTINVTMEDGSIAAGSGFFIDDMGSIVTNYHVIDGAQSISVEISNGGSYSVNKIVDFSDILDVAVLSIDVEGNAYLQMADEKIRTGETVYAIGSSLGFLNGTFSDGIVSSASRTLGAIECIQTTAAISNGNSGGPLVNAFGEVVGINAFSYSGGENLNLAININILDQLSQDKNWNVNQFREWYRKEIERSYTVWNYSTEEWELSKINTYQYVTGRECALSTYDWKFLEGDVENVVEGYHDKYGVYLYEYDVQEFDKYTEYLNSIGFSFVKSEDYTEGISYFYENEFTGFKVDIFIMDGEEVIVVEAYNN